MLSTYDSCLWHGNQNITCNIEKHLLKHEFSDTLSCYNILLTCVSGNFESICLLCIKRQIYFFKIDHLICYIDDIYMIIHDIFDCKTFTLFTDSA